MPEEQVYEAGVVARYLRGDFGHSLVNPYILAEV